MCFVRLYFFDRVAPRVQRVDGDIVFWRKRTAHRQTHGIMALRAAAVTAVQRENWHPEEAPHDMSYSVKVRGDTTKAQGQTLLPAVVTTRQDSRNEQVPPGVPLRIRHSPALEVAAEVEIGLRHDTRMNVDSSRAGTPTRQKGGTM